MGWCSSGLPFGLQSNPRLSQVQIVEPRGHVARFGAAQLGVQDLYLDAALCAHAGGLTDQCAKRLGSDRCGIKRDFGNESMDP